jgi:hypothetical protein
LAASVASNQLGRRMAATWACVRFIGALSAGLGLATLVDVPAFAQVLSPSGVVIPGFPVVTGFSGARLSPIPLPPGVNPVDRTYIDLDGPSLRVIDTSNMGGPPLAQAVPAPKPLTVRASQIGQVFAITLDDAVPPNVYAAATSAFGLPIVVPGAGGLPSRARRGAPNAGFMRGLFGPAASGGGPASIWRLDGRSGTVSLFANVTLDGVPNSGPGLGGMAFDRTNRQIFVADRDTGMIHGFALDGRETGRFDHGAQALPAFGLPPLPFDPRKRLDVTSSAFDSENPATWSYAPPARRVFGLAVNGGRLYYAVAAGNRIWSVSVGADGSFGPDAHVEYAVPSGPVPGTEIAKIIFDDAGNMLLAERGGPTGAYDYGALTPQNSGRVLRLRAQTPGADGTPFLWATVGDYAIGFPPIYQNGDGGIAIGYGYEPSGRATAGACGGTLWTTGSQLRVSPDLPIAQRLAPGGPFPIDGLQGNAVSLLRPQNTPPFSSYFIDFDDRTDITGTPGHMGDVIVWRSCPSAPAPVIAEYVPLILELGVGFQVGDSCRADEILIDGRCDKPQCEPSRTLRGDTCCPRDTNWNPRSKVCEPRQPGRPDLKVVKTVKDKHCGTATLGACSFEIVVTNVGDAPYTGPIVIGDIMVSAGSAASVTAVDIPAGFTCGPIPLPVASGPAGSTALGCINPNAMLAPNQPIGFRFSGSAPTSRAGWRNCALVVGKLPSLGNPASVSNSGGLQLANPIRNSSGALQGLEGLSQSKNSGDPSTETNFTNNVSCIDSKDDQSACAPELLAAGACSIATITAPVRVTTPSCPGQTLPFNGMCCTGAEIKAGRCGRNPSCPLDNPLCNQTTTGGGCSDGSLQINGQCGTPACPTEMFTVNGKCCNLRDIATGACGSRTTTGDCLIGPRLPNGQCPTTTGCAKGQFRGDDGKCQFPQTTNTGKSCDKGFTWNGETCAKDKTTGKSCDKGFTWNGETCAKDKTNTGQSCGKGTTWNGETCAKDKTSTGSTNTKNPSTNVKNTGNPTLVHNVNPTTLGNAIKSNGNQLNSGIGNRVNNPIVPSGVGGLRGKKF